MASSISNFSPLCKFVERLLFSGLFACICGLGLSSARADLNSGTTIGGKKKAPTTGSSQPSAIADAASAEVNRAGEVVVRLRGIARGGGRIEFMLTQKPKYGRIISSKPVGLDSLDVLYRQSGDQSSDSDSFIFAVRSGAGGPFSPGEAKIKIIDQPGRLLAPEEMTFPPTLVGQTASDSFVVVNEGGERLRGKITLSPPWHLSEPATYDLAPGEKHRITLFFAPETQGPSDGQLVFEGTKPTAVALHGEGLGTFQATPTKLTLLPGVNGRPETRGGVFSLQNNTDKPLTIEIQSPLVLPKSVTLQFGEIREITVADNGIGILNAQINLQSGSYSTRIDVTAAEAAPSSYRPAVALNPPPSPPPSPVAISTQPTPMPVLMAATNSTSEETPIETPTPPPSQIMQYLQAKTVRVSQSVVQIEWILPQTNPADSYRIEQRYLLLDKDRKLDPQWVDVPTAEIKITGQQGIARIPDLDPRTHFTFRVSQYREGKPTRLVSQPLQYQTEPRFYQRLTWGSWRFCLFPLGAVLLGLVIRNRLRQRSLPT